MNSDNHELEKKIDFALKQQSEHADKYIKNRKAFFSDVSEEIVRHANNLAERFKIMCCNF